MCIIRNTPFTKPPEFSELEIAIFKYPITHTLFSSVMESAYVMDPPTKIITPYGGRLVWLLPGGNNLIVHLKDKQKIRHRKRWSQVRLKREKKLRGH